MSWIGELSRALLIGTVVFSLGVLCQTRKNLSDTLVREESRFSWTVMVADDDKVKQIQAELLSLPGVKSVDLVTKNKAIEELQPDQILKSSLEALPTNPFHSFFRLTWASSAIQASKLSLQAEKMGKWLGVDSVQFNPTRAQLIENLRLSLSQINLVMTGSEWGGGLALLLWIMTKFLWKACRP